MDTERKMKMTIFISVGPCCWGVDDPQNPYLPRWQDVLSEAHQAGFKGIELGPYTYMPTNVSELLPVLEQTDMTVMTGTIFDDLVAKENLPKLKKATHEICQLISQLPQKATQPNQNHATPYLTIMDFGQDARHLQRDYAAGHPDKAIRLNEQDWDQMMTNILELCQIARSYGVRPVIHPHAGGFIEFADEIEKLTQAIAYEDAGLCLDTGHLYYSKMDPEAFLRTYWDRVDYIHFKDIDLAKYDEVMNKKIWFFDACAEQVMCPIGLGCIDYSRIHHFLTEEVRYEGFITIEQEKDPRNVASTLADLTRSVDYLTSIGFQQ